MPSLEKHPGYELIKILDKDAQFVKEKINRDTRENRMGVFSLRFFAQDGTRIYPDNVECVQTSHEFKFGCSLFLLDQFDEAEKNAAYREKFKRIFNYGVAPIYWDTLEPVEGKPRFEKDSPAIWRRPAIDTVRDYCKENNVRMKAHCLAYNSFNPDWLPDSNHDINVALAKRISAISERYKYDFTDMDVINEMHDIYKNCYKGNGMRDFQITDEENHEKFCFDLAKNGFPCTRLFWNEGCHQTFSNWAYMGTRSRYYLMLRRQLEMGTKIEGIGMQFHAYGGRDTAQNDIGPLLNPLRLLDIFERYSDFRLPIQISEISLPSWSNDPDDEQIQAEVLERLYRLWFSQKNVEAAVWWNLVDGTAYKTENVYHAGLLRNDMTPKPSYEALDRLVNHEWHTEYRGNGKDERFLFDGYYGNYDITFTYEGKKYTRPLRLFRDTTGYDNRLADYRISDVKI